MNVKIVLRDVRIFIDEIQHYESTLALRIYGKQNICQYKNFNWSSSCQRWERKEQIQFTLEQKCPLSFSIFKVKSKTRKLLGQSTVDLRILPQNELRELKNCLKMNGVVVGWLYFQLQIGQNIIVPQKDRFLSIYKISFDFLQCHKHIQTKILLNSLLIFQKQINTAYCKRTIFPNIKTKVKRSDSLICKVSTQKVKILPLTFLIDHVESGQTASIVIWMRNESKVKVGELKIEYFLDSIYFNKEEPQAFKINHVEKKSFLAVSQKNTPKGRFSLFKIRQPRFSHIKQIDDIRKNDFQSFVPQILVNRISDKKIEERQEPKKLQKGISIQTSENSLILPKLI